MKEKLKTICEPVTHVVKLNERNARISLILVIVLLMQIFMPIMRVYAWDATNIKILDLVIESGNIKSFKLSFNVPSGFGLATCRVGLQSNQFESR